MEKEQANMKKAKAKSFDTRARPIRIIKNEMRLLKSKFSLKE
jgi:hypothetical protein